jgi:hypothetical protein
VQRWPGIWFFSNTSRFPTVCFFFQNFEDAARGEVFSNFLTS